MKLIAAYTHCPLCRSTDYQPEPPGQRHCQTCGHRDFNNPITAVSALILDPNGNLLLIRRAHVQSHAQTRYNIVPLADVAGKTRIMPDAFINEEGNGVTDAFRNYCSPLVGSRLPESYRLRAPRVPKIREGA